MKFITLAVFATFCHANIQNIVREYLNSSTEIKKAGYAYNLSHINFFKEDYSRPFTLSFQAEDTDSSLESSTTFARSQSDSKQYTLSLSKDTPWAGEFSLSGTLYDYGSASSNYQYYTQTLTYTQDIGKNFLGRNYRLQLDSSRYELNSQKLSYDNEKSAKVLALIKAYYEAKKNVTITNLQKKALERSSKRLRLVKSQVRDGLKERVDLFNSRTGHQFQIEKLNSSKIDEESSLLNLSRVLEKEVVGLGVDAFTLKEQKLESVPVGKIDKNLSLNSLKKKIASLKMSEKLARNSVLPTINVAGSLGTNNYDNNSAFSDGTFGSENDEVTLSVSVVMPIGLYQEKAAKKTAKLNLLNKKYEYKLTMDKLESSESRLRKTLELLDKNLESATRRLQLAKQTVSETNKLYKRGRVNLDQVIRAEESLIDTELSFVNYIVQRKVYYYTLLDLYGELLVNFGV